MGIERELGKPAAYACSSAVEPQRLLNEARKLSRGNSFILLLDKRRGIEDRLLPAYLNAYLRHRERSMRSESLQIEVLLFAAMTMQIGSAIKSHGIRNQKGFIIFTNRKQLLKRMRKKFPIKLSKELKLSLGSEESGRMAVLPISYVR
ncbi:MAG: hypothetical protein KGH74_04705 [Candidatus Micrarchaeota archaeon]|nr:hypothetical protein [Candidatus Micrarchaeota archaeon]